MRLIFIDTQDAVVSTLKRKFEAKGTCCAPEIMLTFWTGKVQNISDRIDFYVSPGNSYGVMTGGIDYVYRRMFGQQLQDDLQHEIFFLRNTPELEVPVGEVLVIPIRADNRSHQQYFIYAPTMSVPSKIHPDNVGKAFKAIFLELLKIKAISNVDFNVVIPGLGTLSGGVSPEDHAEQIVNTFNKVLFEREINKAFNYSSQIQ